MLDFFYYTGKFLFYAYGLVALVYELYVFQSTGDVVKKLKEWTLKEEKPEVSTAAVGKGGLIVESEKSLDVYGTLLALFHMTYFIWNFIGLFTFQWIAFLGFFLFSTIPKPKTVWAYKIDSLISAAFIFFVILNAYHFKIDLWSKITSLW